MTLTRLPITHCRACGSTALTWQTQMVNRSQVQQGRLTTRDVECVFFLGCDHCSETLANVGADAVARLMSAQVVAPQAAQGLPPITVGLPGEPVVTLDPWADDMRPGVVAKDGVLVIAITTDALLHGVTLASQWPADEAGSPARILDGALMVQEVVDELLREDEQGATAVHRLFDAAALAAVDNGSQAVEYLA